MVAVVEATKQYGTVRRVRYRKIYTPSKANLLLGSIVPDKAISTLQTAKNLG